MKISKKALSVILAVLMLLTCVPAFSFAADEKPKAGQYNLIVEEDGRTTHWEDSEGNIVELNSSSLSSSPKKARAAAAAVPEKYDAREEGLVTPVKAQGSYGNCWAFAATSCVESALIKKGIAGNRIDLSEDHLAWFAKNSLVENEADGTHGDGASYSDMNTAFNVGGTWMDSISTYARGSGPVYESDYPYPTGEWDESHRYNAEFRVTDCSAIDMTSANMTKIKRAIMQYGSVKTSYYSHTGFYNVTENNGSAYYYPDAGERTNHDVTIVGWDDNYAIENYNYEYQPKNKGAWLVKNSWGESSPHLDEGYFWMSYDESEIKTVSYYDADVKSIYDNTYQYDGAGSYSALYYMGRSSAYGGNVFTAKGHENLNYVGFYTEAGANYTIYIYKLNNQKDYPTNGTLVSTTYGYESYYGYHTAKLSTPVEVNPGDVFSVVLQINMYDGSDAKIFTEGITYDFAAEDYQSYFGTDKQFMDMVSKTSGDFKTAGNVCVKVMSKDISECNHNYSSSYTAPTCTSRGGTTYTCSICGDSYMTDVVAPIEHTVEIDAAVAPTCEKTGLTEGKHCSVCKTVFVKQKEIPAMGHKWVGTVIKQPTCTEAGTASNGICSVCGAVGTETVVLPATGHTVVYDEATKATCTEPGYSAGTHCSVCNEILSGHYIVWPSGHNEVNVSTVSATCTENGHKAGVQCSVCGAVISGMETIPATGHSYGDWETVEGGGRKRVCSSCGYIQTEGAESCNHVVVADPAVAPTCTEKGLTEGSHCSVCGAVIKAQEAVEALGHRPEIVPETPATCTASGLTEGSRCSVCSAVLKEQEYVPATGHMYGAWEIERPSTCTQNGITKKTCSSCGFVYRSMTAKKNHSYVTDPAVEPTCTETGLTSGMHCSSCGTIVTAQTVLPAKGHSYGDWETVKSATCAAEGEEKAVCSSCGDVQKRTLEKLSHTVVTDAEKKATCTEAGLTEGTHCSVCGEVLTKQEVIEALDHTPEIDEAVAPTCTKPGLSMGSHCSVCGEVLLEQEEIEALGHSYGDWETVKSATCTAEGEEKAVCSSCGDVQKRTVGKTAHTESAWIVDSDASCVKGGEKHTECTVCHVILKTETIPATGNHVYTDLTVDPTCTTKGFTTHTCSVCGNSYVDSYVDETGHTEEILPSKSATCTEAGFTEGKKCSVCGEVLAAQSVVPAKGHTEEILPSKSATCTETGLTEGKKCSVCGEVLVEQSVVPAKGHTEEILPSKSATCTETGLTEGKKCSACGEVLEAQNEVPAKGHTEEILPAVAATCTETGLTEGKKCSVCGEVLAAQSVVPAKGHTEEILPAVAATCTETGLTEGKKCSVCGEILVAQSEVPAKGHTEEILPSKSATCTETGLTEGKKCSVCGEVFVAQSVVPAKGHTEEILPSKSATCTEAGLTEGKKCSVCGKVLAAQSEVPMKEHSYGEWATVENATCSKEGTAKRSCTVCGNVQTKALEKTAHSFESVVTDATCTAEGFTTHTCTVCGESVVDSRVPALGHAYGEWKTVKEATCTENGQQTRNCSRCSVTETRSIEKLSHSDADGGGYCDGCGEEIGKDCSCLCHSKSGFGAFIWKIKLFFIRIFGVQKVCACGKKHY